MTRAPRPRPLVLVTPCSQRRGVEHGDLSVSLSAAYTDSLIAAGCLPWILPVTVSEKVVAEAVARCDGVLLTGGGDLNPSLYTARLPRALRRTVVPEARARDVMELMVVREVLRQRRPLFAICRGHQLLNVALGGSLIVDLPSRPGGGLNHRRTRDKDRIVHKVALTPGSLLNRLTRRQAIGVNSTHHQAVGRVAGLLRATAVSPDGVVEAIEPVPEAARDLPWLLGVQFHPERLGGRHPEHAALFQAFAGACRSALRKRTL